MSMRRSCMCIVGPLGIAAALLCAASPALAKGWDTPTYGLTMSAFGTSQAFPGSLGSGPDQGIDPTASIASSLRLKNAMKLGLGVSGGLHAQQQFSNANYGWLGFNSNLRRNRTTLTLEGNYTPKRNKFPTDPTEGGQYTGSSLTAGWRQTVGQRARLRIEYSLEREKFVPAVSDRDGLNREWGGQYVFSPGRGLDLRVEGALGTDRTSSRKFVKDDHWVGGGGVWSDSLWRIDLSARSGLRTYTDAILGDTNFQRRDQWIELRLRAGRELRPGFASTAGVTLTDQTSSRIDRSYTAATITLGLEWTGGGK